MKYSKFILLCLALIYMQCSEKSDPVPDSKTVLVLSLSIDTQYPTSESDDWVVLNSTDGRLIEYKPFESGDNFTFETLNQLPDDEVNVTLFRMLPSSEVRSYSFTSYLHVSTGQEWTVKMPKLPSAGGKQVGEFYVEVTGVEDEHAVALTDQGQHWGNSSSYSGETNTYNAARPIYDNAPDFFLFVMDHLGKPRYKWFRNVADQDLYKLSVNEMNAFDHELEVNFPLTSSYSYHIASFDGGQEEYSVCSNLSYANLSPKNNLKLGYSDDFTKYYTSLRFQYDDRSIEYLKIGARPSAITLPLNAVFTTLDKSFDHFVYTQNQPFVRRSSVWTYWDTEGTPMVFANCVVESPQGPQVQSEWPEELATKYADFSFDKLEYESTSFYTESPSFQEYLNMAFKGSVYPEITSIRVIVD